MLFHGCVGVLIWPLARSSRLEGTFDSLCVDSCGRSRPNSFDNRQSSMCAVFEHRFPWMQPDLRRSVKIHVMCADTEIDWHAYVEEVDGFLSGELDYANLRGGTGPLVYPAGFVYLFSAIRWLTQASVAHAQVCYSLASRFSCDPSIATRREASVDRIQLPCLVHPMSTAYRNFVRTSIPCLHSCVFRVSLLLGGPALFVNRTRFVIS